MAHNLRNRAKRQEAWVPIQGTILSSEVRFNGEEYVPCIRYEYKHEGVNLSGTLIRSGLITYNWSGPAHRVCARFPTGAHATVFVNPSDPSKSVLERGGDRMWLPFAYGFSIISVVFALLVLFAP